jgi:hypothetical protein
MGQLRETAPLNDGIFPDRVVNVAPHLHRFPARWLTMAGLWLLLTGIFASQLYWAGYVRPWTKAFGSEAVYWLALWILAPSVFLVCRKLHAWDRGWRGYVLVLLLGVLAASVLQSLVVDVLQWAKAWLEWWLAVATEKPAQPFAGAPARAIRMAGINLPVFGALVLAWHAAIYYRESRDRQLQAVELESLLRQSQLQALRSQLNPHFLFNTLHSIAELVHENPNLAEELLVRLGALLRKALASRVQQEVALAEEIDFIKGYVEIEQMRLGDRLQVEWEIAAEALDCRVPSMILQPLVENSIQHGIGPLNRPGKLKISARRENEFLHLDLRDNGTGLPQGAPARGAGIGLSNTEARLRHVYGDRQRLDLINDNGLVVRLRLPVLIPITSMKGAS